MWVLALNLTAAIVACVIMVRANDLFTHVFGIVLLYANIVCVLINVKRLF